MLLFTTKFGPKMENDRQPARAELTSCASREAARRRKWPAARSPSDHAPRARPLCGPRRKPVHRPARAQRVPRSRPQPGPGPGKSLPAWAESRSGDRELSISIRRLREVPCRTNRLRRPRANPSLISLLFRSLSRAATSDSERRQRERARGAVLSPSPVCTLTVG
jgi:hypothetical protein